MVVVGFFLSLSKKIKNRPDNFLVVLSNIKQRNSNNNQHVLTSRKSFNIGKSNISGRIVFRGGEIRNKRKQLFSITSNQTLKLNLNRFYENIFKKTSIKNTRWGK